MSERYIVTHGDENDFHVTSAGAITWVRCVGRRLFKKGTVGATETVYPR